MTVQTIRVLRAARKLVANENTWTQCTMVRDASGRSVFVDDALHKLMRDRGPFAFCALGAVRYAGQKAGLTRHEIEPLAIALDRIAFRDFSRISLVALNDHEGREPALAVIDTAIRELGYEP